MANHGKLEEYDPQEEWSQYIEQLEFYFEANGVDNVDKQRAILLSVCGSRTYKLIRNLTMPGKPSDKTFKEIVELVQNHENPKPSAIVQRFKFNTRFRKPGELIASYVAELRNISEHCDFQNTLEEMLRDRLVCGINDEQIQRRLLAESTLDFKKAMKIATSMETAIKNAKDLTNQTSSGNDSLNRVGDEAQRDQQGTRTAEDVGVDTIPNNANLRMLSVLCVTRKGTYRGSVETDKKEMVKVNERNRHQIQENPKIT